MRSTVPSTRSKSPPTARANARRIVVLPTPTSPSSSTWPARKQSHVDQPDGILLAQNGLANLFLQVQGPGAPVMQLLSRYHRTPPSTSTLHPYRREARTHNRPSRRNRGYPRRRR